MLNNNMNENTPQGQGQTPDPNLAKIENDLAAIKNKAQEEMVQTSSQPTNPPAVYSQPQAETTPQPQVNIPPQTSPTQPLTTSQEGTKGGGGGLVKIAAVLLILAILAVVAYFTGNYFTGLKTKPSPTVVATEVPVETPSATLDPTVDWKTYSTSTYEVKYPSEIIPKEQEGSAVTFSKWGPTQKEGTELYDGYSVSFVPREIPNTTLESYVNAKIEEVKKQEVSKVTSGPNVKTINGYRGLSYVEEGLGTYTQIILESKDKIMFVEISVLVSDPGNLGFQEVVDNILSSFKFFETSASASPKTSPASSSSLENLIEE